MYWRLRQVVVLGCKVQSWSGAICIRRYLCTTRKLPPQPGSVAFDLMYCGLHLVWDALENTLGRLCVLM